MTNSSPRSELGVREASDWAPPFRLFVLLRVGQLDRSEAGGEESLPEAIGEFLKDTRPILANEGKAEISHRSGYLFLNGRRLPVDFSAFHATRFLVETFRVHRIGGICFRACVDTSEIESLVTALITEKSSATGVLAEKLAAEGVEHIDVMPLVNAGVDPLATRPREQARRTRETHFRSLFITKRILGGIRPRDGLNVRLAKRIIHGIVDLLLEDQETLTALTELREAGGTLFDHSLNVAVLSVLAGQQMGLPRRLLGSLGSAALFHDYGLIDLPQDMPRDIRQWKKEDKETLRSHTIEGFLELLKGRDLSDLALRNAIVAWEHHLKPDGTGSHACSREPFRPTLLSRIVSVADTFEVLCSVGANGNSLSSKEALEQLSGPLSEHYDPAVVTALAAALG